ncbi:hypothetical protein [Hydrogenophaga sp. NFH-34]|uniref:hypothetical protein n=1 Tax=Hydrogenophaga sp. NFH-34 TaxID=2744446 RepID=UPI001F175CF6|nr:hypothetical protein [Hydrogenophaga sp. NFH-34]
MKQKLFKHLAAIAAATGSGLALAQSAGPDMSALTGSVDFGTTLTAVLAIAALLAGVYVAIRASKIVLAMIRGG